MNESKKVALVTGAALRVGRSITKALAAKGYRVAIHYRSSQKDATDLANDINSEYGQKSAKTFKADLNNTEAVKTLPRDVHEAFGRLDILVNNASIFEKTPLGQMTYNDIERYHATHVLAPATLCLESSKWLKEAGPGHIVNMVDVYADYPKKGYLPYTVSKAGLKALTRQLAVELAPDILVNAIAPGAILEPSGEGHGDNMEAIINKVPLKRFGKPEDITKAVLFLAEAKYITGQTIVVDGGRSLNI